MYILSEPTSNHLGNNSIRGVHPSCRFGHETRISDPSRKNDKGRGMRAAVEENNKIFSACHEPSVLIMNVIAFRRIRSGRHM